MFVSFFIFNNAAALIMCELGLWWGFEKFMIVQTICDNST